MSLPGLGFHRDQRQAPFSFRGGATWRQLHAELSVLTAGDAVNLGISLTIGTTEQVAVNSSGRLLQTQDADTRRQWDDLAHVALEQSSADISHQEQSPAADRFANASQTEPVKEGGSEKMIVLDRVFGCGVGQLCKSNWVDGEF